jgi:hypothetical protein
MSSNGTAKITSSMYWWLNSRRPFIINDEYKIELYEIDHRRNTVKIIITNLKDQSTSVEEVKQDDCEDSAEF